MKSFYLIVCCLILSGKEAASQNLVPNPGFEINNSCPTQINQVDKADGWSTWATTPDYYHSCANIPNPMFGTPFNSRGFQVPHSGQAYIGLFTFADFAANSREFVGRELQQPLVPGQQYFVSLWVCSVEQLLATHSSDKLGVRFTTAPHSMFNPDTALNNGHVFTTAVISDSVNWTQISGSFIADSAYTHIGIGNYFDDANTTVVLGDPSSNYAYYLIDDICVSTDPQDCGVETGINELAVINKLHLYPNPASNQIKLWGFVMDVNTQIQISDLSGRIVLNSAATDNNAEVNISMLKPGAYTVMVKGPIYQQFSRFVKIGN
ncbi:MAG TPA: T9SS type A sorting domain-containing protein [Bacteroidia bacterium]|nr:T9SS type A sorting domain-containing protein [Bacteroidia bacterium]